MGKPWAVFFAVNMLAMAGLCFAAPALGWWMPEGVSTHADSVDFLFNIILAITTFFFFLTEALLVIFLWKYGSGEKPVALGETPEVVTPFRAWVVRPVTGLLNNQHKVEMAWTVVPAAILLYIAFAQVNTWAHIKYQSRLADLVGDKMPIQVELNARQFEWRFRYPSVERMRLWLNNAKEWSKTAKDSKIKADMDSFARTIQFDDIHVVNELHIFGDKVKDDDKVKDKWVGNPVLIHLSTRDVLHSFNLPQFRVKQDALPGKVIPVWFTPTKPNVQVKESGGLSTWYDGDGRDAQGQPINKLAIWDIPCAELCGWGHWRMVGRVYVHPTQEDFLNWLTQVGQEEHSRTAPK